MAAGDADINSPRQTQGVLGNHSEEDARGGEKQEMRRTFSGGRRQGPLVGWLVVFLTGEGIRQEIQFRYLPNAPRAPPLPRPQGQETKNQGIRYFYSTTSKLHLPHSGMNILANPVNPGQLSNRTFCSGGNIRPHDAQYRQPLITCGY